MPTQTNALDLLRADHRKVLSLISEFEKTEDEREQRNLCEEIVTELETHARLEEDVFYPYLREASDRIDLLNMAQVEHNSAKNLMEELEKENSDLGHFQAMVKVLGEYLRIHVRDEEEQIFPLAESLGVDLEALGQELADHKEDLQQGMSKGNIGKNSGGGKEASAAKRSQGEEGAGQHGQEAVDTAKEDEKFLEEYGEGLSKSTRRARWIHSAEEHEDRPGQTLATRNHAVIRQWAEERGGVPCTSPNGDAERPRVLRFNFPGFAKNMLEVSWDAWLGTFDERELVFLYQEHKKEGSQSNFFRLDNPHREDA